MAKYIDADLIDWKVIAVPTLDGEFVRTTELNGFYAIKQDVDAMPAADVKEVRHGKWAHLGGEEWCCSCCGFVKLTEGSWEKPSWKYCEGCGARMDLEEENAEIY